MELREGRLTGLEVTVGFDAGIDDLGANLGFRTWLQRVYMDVDGMPQVATNR